MNYTILHLLGSLQSLYGYFYNIHNYFIFLFIIVLFNFCIIFQLKFEDIVLQKVLPICLSHIHHCQQVEKGEKIARHYAVRNRKVEIMYLKKVTSSLMPFILRQNDVQCKYELN